MLDQNQINQLHEIALAMVAPGKGILAADESTGTIKKRFDAVGVESTEENRRAYRQMLFTTPGIEEFISGVILYDETIRQTASDGTSFVKFLQSKNILPGIKVDTGTEDFNGSEVEKITKGLEDLPQRLKEYYGLGARFAKWRAVITIKAEQLPTSECILENALRLAQYAKDCQQAGLVPIVEPEVLMDGNHTIERCAVVTLETLKQVFRQLKEKEVILSALILKPNMVISAKQCANQATFEEVAQWTLKIFNQVIPSEVPGIAFLSGGQSDAQATENLNEINKIIGSPWRMSFSYGRALQAPALKVWSGQAENFAAAQAAFYKRAKVNSLVRNGAYSQAMETAGGSVELISQD